MNKRNIIAILIILIVSIYFLTQLGKNSKNNLVLNSDTNKEISELNKSPIPFSNSDRELSSNESTFKKVSLNSIQPNLQRVTQSSFDKKTHIKINSLTHDSYYCTHKNPQVPINLEWTQVETADSYEVEILRTYKNTASTFFTTQSNKHIEVSPNARYLWRVRAIKNNKPISNFTQFYQLYTKAPYGSHILTVYERNFPKNSGKYKQVTHYYKPNLSISTLPKELDLNTDEQKYKKEPIKRSPSSLPPPKNKSQMWVKLGTGINQFIYTQDLDGIANLEHDSFNGPTIYSSLGLEISKNHALMASYFQTPGKMKDEAINLDSKFKWENFSIEGIYKVPHISQSHNWRFYLKYGFNYHEIPLLEIYPTTLSPTLSKNKIYNLSLAVGSQNHLTKNTHLDISLHYQHPLDAKSSSENFKLESGQVLGGFIEYGYDVNLNSTVNAFFNSELYNAKFNLNNGTDKVTGTQKLINNILGINFTYNVK